MKLKSTGERVIEGKNSENSLNYLRHKAAYVFAEKFIKDKTVLDNGCGSGYGSYYLATNGAKKVIGVDISEEAVAYAKHKYNFENLEFKTADSAKLDFDDETFDVVTSFQVIEHISNTEKFLLEAKRVLKKSGVALISTPNKKTYSPNTPVPENPFHVKEFYSNEFTELLRACFDEVEIVGVSRSPNLEKFEQSFNRSLRHRFKKLLNKFNFSFLLWIIPKLTRYFLSEKVKENIDISDFRITKCNLEQSLDFIGICKKYEM